MCGCWSHDYFKTEISRDAAAADVNTGVKGPTDRPTGGKSRAQRGGACKRHMVPTSPRPSCRNRRSPEKRPKRSKCTSAASQTQPPSRTLVHEYRERQRERERERESDRERAMETRRPVAEDWAWRRCGGGAARAQRKPGRGSNIARA